MKIKSIVIVLLSILMAACGGGGSSPTPAAAPQPAPIPQPELVISTGQFIDAFVEGLNYQTATQSGRTTMEGRFNYAVNEMVTFSIGDLKFPATLAEQYVTPLDIYNTDSFSHVAMVNMIRLLQTLDLDGMPDNGIEIPEMSHVLAAGLTIDFNDSNFDQLVEELVANSGGPHFGLVSAEAALTHFKQSLSELNDDGSGGCTANHPSVGFTGTFQTNSHNVAGSAHIVDDCTIEISSFDYDGGGPLVYFYGALNEEYSGSDSFAVGDRIDGQVFENSTITLRLPQGRTLDEMDGLSVWCADFNVNFGNVEFTAP